MTQSSNKPTPVGEKGTVRHQAHSVVKDAPVFFDVPFDLALSLCSEAEVRAAMSDDDFWAHVYASLTYGHEPEGPNQLDEEDMVAMSNIGQPCPECGQVGPCAYDNEGRALIHVTEHDDG